MEKNTYEKNKLKQQTDQAEARFNLKKKIEEELEDKDRELEKKEREDEEAIKKIDHLREEILETAAALGIEDPAESIDNVKSKLRREAENKPEKKNFIRENFGSISQKMPAIKEKLSSIGDGIIDGQRLAAANEFGLGLPDFEDPSNLEHALTASAAERPVSRVTERDYAGFKERYEREHESDGLAAIVAGMEKTIPEFKTMDPGTRMLAIEALNQRLGAEVEERARQKFAEKMHATSWHGKIRNAARHGLRKNYLTDTFKREAVATLTTHELDSFIAKNAGTVRFLAEKDPSLDVIYDGKEARIDYAGQNRAGETKAERAIAHEYNLRAKALQNIPKEWTYDDARPKEKRAYEKARKALEAFEPQMLALMDNRYKGNKESALYETGLARKRIEAMSFLSQSPKATDTLHAIATRSEGSRIAASIAKFWTDKYSGENLKYTMTGAGIKALLKAGIGYAVTGTILAGTAPISIPAIAAMIGIGGATAGGIGYFRGKDAAKEQFRQEDKNARDRELTREAREKTEKQGQCTDTANDQEHRPS